MYISEVKLENWLNFGKETSAKLDPVSYVLGVNASGKSNLLDALRFLRDVANPSGGGLQYAVDERGGMKNIRCLHAKAQADVTIEVTIAKNEKTPAWWYRLSFNNNPKSRDGALLIKQEMVSHYQNGKWKEVLNRPNGLDKEDTYVLSQTYIEQKSEHLKFRELVDFFAGTTYYHLVPQFLQFADHLGKKCFRNDPFGQDFLERVANTPEKARNKYLKNIANTLRGVVPYFNDLQFVRPMGKPHLEISYQHNGQNGAKQLEDRLSDGTLRLAVLLWILQEDGESPLLLEEPELSLNEKIAEQVPLIIDKTMRLQGADYRRQVIITTHSHAVLSNPGIGHEQITVIEAGDKSSILREADELEIVAMEAGLPPSQIVLPALHNDQLPLKFG